MSEDTQAYREKLNQHIRDFANVVNDAARNGTAVTVMPEEAEAICALSIEQTIYYVRLVSAKMINVNPNINTTSAYGKVIAKLERAATSGEEVVLSYAEVEEYSKVANELTCYDLFIQYLNGVINSDKSI